MKNINFPLPSISLHVRLSPSTPFSLPVIISILNTVMTFPSCLLICEVKNHKSALENAHHDRGHGRLCSRVSTRCSVLELGALLVSCWFLEPQRPCASSFCSLLRLLPPTSQTQSQLVEKEADFISAFS